MRSKIMLALLIVTQLAWTNWAAAATYPQPPATSAFNMTGFIQAATLGNPCDVLSGGTVTVNSIQITIPSHTIVIMSATNLSWQELWGKAPAPWGLPPGLTCSGVGNVGNGQTGLALSDSFTDPVTGAVTKPLTTYEVTIQGNRIKDSAGNDLYVAALVFMAQQSLNLGQGFINFIDYATGTLHVGCQPLRTACPAGVGARIQLNDPVGRYGRPVSPDPRFTADTDNPTIRAKTGYPMCIPRTGPPPLPLRPDDSLPAGYTETDPLCPQINRPLDPDTGGPLGNFTLGPIRNFSPVLVGVVPVIATAIQNGDPSSQAPFQVGDYIEYSGTIQLDDGSTTGAAGSITGVLGCQPAAPSTCGRYLSAWQIVANVGIYTSPNTELAFLKLPPSPAYLALELTILGTGGTPINAPIPVPMEVTTRIKARGFFTDPTRTVDLYAVVLDPCTGAETESLMLQGIPNQKGNIPWGRFRDVDQQGLFPITRQWRVRYTPLLDPTNDPPGPVSAANGLVAMQYTIPVSTFLTPENTVYGDPTLLVVPQNFQDFPFLAKGEGPWRGDLANIVGQLSPFPLTTSIPGLTPPAPPAFVCAPGAKAPVAVVSPADQTVRTNANVTLDATKSTDPAAGTTTASCADCTFSWIQTSGPTVTLTATKTPGVVTFKAPDKINNVNISVNTPLSFKVTVTSSNSKLSTDGFTDVMVTPFSFSTPDVVAITAVTYKKSRGVLNMTVTSTDPTCSAILRLTAKLFDGSTYPYPVNGVVTPMYSTSCTPGTAGTPATYTFVTPREVFPAPTSVTVQSDLGGIATAPPPPFRIQ